MAAKQLIVVVEGTMAMEPYWPTMVSDYVEKIIRSLPGNELCGQGKRNPRAADPPTDNLENPNFLVLISENFIEARATLSRPGKGLTSLPPPTSNPSAGSSSGTGTMNPTLGISQQAQSGIQSLGADNSSVSNPLSQQTSSDLHPAQFESVKVWEGNLYFSGWRQGSPVFITRLEGYICFSAFVAFATNLPPTLQIVRVTPQELMYSSCSKLRARKE
ncbi:hypothetical protein ACLB2K_048996 [Fragaria x ananassa]